MLIDEIINLLSNTNASLTEALLKTKILLHKIGHKELAEWVNGELNGYPDGSDVPKYRILSATVRANFENIARRYTNHQIPLNHLTEEQQRMFTELSFRQSLAVIEDLVSKDNEGSIQRIIPVEYGSALGKGIDPSFSITSVWSSVGAHDVKGILTQVRSRLLDFLLELKGKMSDAGDEEASFSQASKVDTQAMFANAIFGANAQIFIGDNQRNKVQNIYHNQQTLFNELERIGVSKDDIDELAEAISGDEKESGKPSLTGKVGRWLSNMVAKAVSGSIEVGVDVISTTGAKLLKEYIGPV